MAVTPKHEIPRCCGYCSKPLVRRPDESNQAFGLRQYCGDACRRRAYKAGALARWKIEAQGLRKPCTHCGKLFPPGEGVINKFEWERRKACSPKCAGALRSKLRANRESGVVPAIACEPNPHPVGDPLGDALAAARLSYGRMNRDPGDGGRMAGVLLIPRSMTGNSSAMCAL